MVKTRLVRRHRLGWPRLALMAVATTLILTTQGCCSWMCEDDNERTVTHTFVIAENMDGCIDTDCVCCLPRGLTVRPSDKIRIVNTTDYDVTVDWAEGAEIAFVEGIDTFVGAKKTETITIVGEIPEDLSEGFGSELNVAGTGSVCTGAPSPGIDWD